MGLFTPALQKKAARLPQPAPLAKKRTAPAPVAPTPPLKRRSRIL